MELTTAVVTLTAVASLVGTEWTVAMVFHPLLDRLAPNACQRARAESAQIMGRIMPFWYAATLLSSVSAATAAFLAPAGTGTPFAPWLWLIVATSMGIIILLTVRILVPLNTRLATTSTPHDQFSRDAARWDVLHRRRTLALGLVLILTIAATLVPR